jgi:ribosome biogenesis GTPase
VTALSDTGCVVECWGRRVLVATTEGERVACKLRGRGLDPVAGDEVDVERPSGDDEWVVTERRKRRNVFCRSDSRGRTEALAANLDQLCIVVAPRPDCDPYIVDRYVAGAAYTGIGCLLIVNKRDLPGGTGDLSFVAPLRESGLDVLSVSARSGEGLDDLIARLANRRSLFAGQSGVGKSSLLNALAGDAVRAVGRLSERTDEGRHTTVTSAILQTPWGEIADSPGVRDFAPPVVPLPDVQTGFAEIAARAADCRFPDCLHLREPQCAVHAAVESGAIDTRRYESYRRLVTLTRQLDERRGWPR